MAKYTFMASGEYNRRWRRGGAPSWYDGSWAKEGQSLSTGYKESRDGGGKCKHREGRDGTAREPGGKAVKKVKAAGKVLTKNYVVLMSWKKCSLRKTYKNQAEAQDNV